MSPEKYQLTISPTARKQLAESLPESVAFAVFEFITGTLLENPQRVGKRIFPIHEGRYSARRGTYRVIYKISETNNQVIVLAVAHRSDAYRPN